MLNIINKMIFNPISNPKHIGLLIGFILALTDVSMMSLLKNISLHNYSILWMTLITTIYAIQPWVFLSALDFTSMTILNLSWDLFSDILVSFAGIYVFKEAHSDREMLGICFALIAVYLFATDKNKSIPQYT